MRAGGAGSASTASRKRFAATIGPTVCELEGPIPILKRSKTLIMVASRRHEIPRRLAQEAVDVGRIGTPALDTIARRAVADEHDLGLAEERAAGGADRKDRVGEVEGAAGVQNRSGLGPAHRDADVAVPDIGEGEEASGE